MTMERKEVRRRRRRQGEGQISGGDGGVWMVLLAPRDISIAYVEGGLYVACYIGIMAAIIQ